VVALLRRETPTEAVAEAKRLMFEGTQEERLAFTQSAVSRFSDHAGVRLEFAYALRAGEDERARSEALKAIELERSGDTVLLARAAALLFGLGEVRAARECIERARLAQPTNLVVMNRLNHVEGQIALAGKDYAGAERLLRQAHDGDPADGFIAWDLAVLIASREGGSRPAEALAVIDETLLTIPQSGSDGVRAREILLARRETIQKLVGNSTNGLAEPPNPSRTIAPPAESSADNTNQEDSWSSALGGNAKRRRRGTRAGSPAEALVRARDLLGREQYRRHLTFTERAAELFPADAQISLEHATALKPFDRERAQAEALRAVELEVADPLIHQAHLLRAGRLLLELEDVGAARSVADRLAATEPSEVTILNGLRGLNGAISAAAGEDSEAERNLRMAHRVDPVDSLIAIDLARLLERVGRPQEAAEIIDQTLSTAQRPGVFQAQASRELARLRTTLSNQRPPPQIDL
jgi:Flp pilus assembly protein TadD